MTRPVHQHARRKTQTRRKRQPEAELHKDIVRFLRRTVKQERCIWWHTANGGFRPKATAREMMAMGALAGLPDLLFVHMTNGEVRITGVELKTAKGRLKPPQKAVMAWFATVLDTENAIAVCRTPEEVEAHLRKRGVPMSGTMRTVGPQERA